MYLEYRGIISLLTTNDTVYFTDDYYVGTINSGKDFLLDWHI